MVALLPVLHACACVVCPVAQSRPQALPASVRDAQVRRLTGELLVVLQKREAAARDAARRALAEAAVALGPEVLPFMVREMREVLKRGTRRAHFCCVRVFSVSV